MIYNVDKTKSKILMTKIKNLVIKMEAYKIKILFKHKHNMIKNLIFYKTKVVPKYHRRIRILAIDKIVKRQMVLKNDS